MNEVPLIQDVRKNDINTSIIAIKKQLKLLIEAVGLIESPNSPDMSPYVKKTDIVDYVQIGNQNPVTSNGVYVALTELEERIDENIVDNVENGDLRPVTSNAVSQSLSYSTTEQKTGGKWIDGKPIYRRVYNLPQISGANYGNVETNATYIDTIISAIMISGANTRANFSIAAVMNGTTLQAYAYNGTGTNAKMVMEYTKTTD